MRTDEQLKRDVTAELTWEPSVDAAHIGVQVNDGVVTLAGRVDNYAEKWNAERAAQRVSGVKTLATKLEVHLSGLTRRTDGGIADAVENVLEWSSALPVGAVKVVVEDGWVTLSGDVHWQFQKQAAADSVRQLLGVSGVTNQINIKPSAAAKAVQADIEAALERASIANAQAIGVAVHGASVTLSGTVHNWSERESATYSTWGSPGVKTVVDKMTLD